MKAVSIDQFHLKKVKQTKTGGLEATYQANGETWNVESKTVPHPDLSAAIRALAGVQSDILSIDKSRLSISGIALSGHEDTFGVIITGTMEVEAGNTKVALNTPRIMLSRETYGIEEEIQGHIERIVQEVHSYLFENKQSQLELYSIEEAEEE